MKGLVELVIGTRERGTRERPSRVVHEEVDTSEFVERPLHQPIELVGLQDVGGYDESFTPVLLDDLRDLDQRVLPPGSEYDVRSCFGESDRDPPPNAAPCARYDGNAAVHSEPVENHEFTLRRVLSAKRAPTATGVFR